MAESGNFLHLQLREPPLVYVTNVGRSDKPILAADVIRSNGQEIGFAACVACNRLYKYNSRTTGTSHLRRHNCEVPLEPERLCLQLHTFVSVDLVSKEAKDNILEKCVSMITTDLLPVSIIEGKGFRNLVEALLKLGSNETTNKAMLNVDHVLPEPSTVTQTIAALSKSSREVVIPDILYAFVTSGGAITVNTWTDCCRKISYLCLVAHYAFNSLCKWTLKTRILFVDHFPVTDELDETIRTAVNKALSTFDLQVLVYSGERVMFVTDPGVDLVPELKESMRLNCVVQMLFDMLEHVFTPGNFTKFPEVLTTLDTCHKIIQHLESTTIPHLEGLLRQHQRRHLHFFYKYLMLRTLNDEHTEIERSLYEHGRLDCIHGLNLSILTDLVSVLKPIFDALEQLCDPQSPTIQLVYVIVKMLETTYSTVESSDEPWVSHLKCVMVESLKLKVQVHSVHKAAAALDPRRKRLKFLDETTRLETYAEIRRLCHEFDINRTIRHQQNASVEPEPKKKKQTFLSGFDDSDSEKCDDDLDAYLSGTSRYDGVGCLLGWWWDNRGSFPLLSEVACFILSIPSTNKNGIDFSRAQLSKKCSLLSPEIVNDVMFMHNNL